MKEPPDANKARKGSKGLQPSVPISDVQQSWEHGRDSLDSQSSFIPRFRPYGSLGQDGRYQNGEYLRGACRKSNQTSFQSIKCAGPNKDALAQQSLSGTSSQVGGTTAKTQLSQGAIDLTNDDDEEPNPAWLGAVDYHKFLSITANRNTRPTLNSTAAIQASLTTPRKLANADVDCHGSNIPLTITENRSANKSKSPSRTLRSKPSRPLRERKSQALREQFASEEPSRIPRPAGQDSTQIVKPKRSVFLRERTQESLSDNLFGIPAKRLESLSSKASISDVTKIRTPQKEGRSFPTSATTPSTTRGTRNTPILKASPTIATHIDQKTASFSNPSDSGPFESPVPITWRYPRLEATIPIRGALPPQKSPPTNPPPKPPVTSNRQSLQTKSSRSIMSDSAAEGDFHKPRNASLPSTGESLPEPTISSEQPSVSTTSTTAITSRDAKDIAMKNKGPSLRNKVSKLFGEERNSRSSDTSVPSTSIPAYRPISLASHDSNGVSFSDIFDEAYNAAHGSCQSADDSHASVGVSALSREASVAHSNIGNPSASNVLTDAASVAPLGDSRKSTHISSRSSGLLMGTLTINSENSRQFSQLDSVKDTSKPAMSREELADQLASRLGLSDPAARAQILSALTMIVPPSLHEHPAIRGDLGLQYGVGLLKDKNMEAASSAAILDPNVTPVPSVIRSPTIAVHVPPLHINRQRPFEITDASKKSQKPGPSTSQVPSGLTCRYLVQAHDMAKNLVTPTPSDPCPTFDRTVDLTWYRYTELIGKTHRRVHQPQLPRIFGYVSTMFIAKYARGVENWTKYDQPKYKRRFRYFDLQPSIRFQIMQKLLEGYLPRKFVLLNGQRQASPAWPAGEFATLWDVLGPLQNYLTTCPRLRADVMVTVLMTQPFHVIFSPHVKPGTQPLPTKWLLNYAQYMQNVRVEVDMTKLGFGFAWESTLMSTKLQEIGNLVWSFVEEMQRRDPETNPMTLLTIYCRRYFGYRQGKNHFEGNSDIYQYPLIGGEKEGHDPTVKKGLPRYHGRLSASLPPSANHPYSKQRLHHTFSPDRVPFVHESHMSVFHPFRRLKGRVWIVRLVGLTEKWVRDWHTAFWPEEERIAIPDASKLDHIDRCTPTEFTYVAHNHAIYVDGGISTGIQRIPAFPEKAKRTCIYDKENDVFLEDGTCNVLTVMENGVEVIPRADTRSMPRSELSATGGPNDSIELPDHATTPSKITAPVCDKDSRNTNTVRRASNRKAAKVLGVTILKDGLVGSVTSSSPEDTENDLATPTQSRTISNPSLGQHRPVSFPEGSDHSEQNSRASSVQGHRSRTLSTKKSFLSLLSRDSKKSSK